VIIPNYNLSKEESYEGANFLREKASTTKREKGEKRMGEVGGGVGKTHSLRSIKVGIRGL